VPINKANDKPFSDEIIDYFKGKDNEKMFLVQNNILVLNSFPGFHGDQETLGWSFNEPLYDDYETAENKMILTGRNEKMREKIMRILKYLGISFPNYGLKLFLGKSDNIESFKINEIMKSIKEFGWDVIHFYEDREDWLNNTETAVMHAYPEIEFVAHLVTNVKQKRKLEEVLN
jgi:hypothetical protein